VLKVTLDINGTNVTVLAIHFDVRPEAKNLEEAKALRKTIESLDTPVVLGGDFNATPDSPSMQEIRASHALRGPEAFSPTYVAYPPKRTIDYVFGPSDWTLVTEEALGNDVSDHFAVVAIFRLDRKY
jgi:endonuclease/exonuclease/phosphatase (EEP) superfamily protein YafD